jgi:ADP-ribose pyrophosphatase YjhB (NUDIX family)
VIRDAKLSLTPLDFLLVISYCTQCGASTSPQIPPGDNLPREVCCHCGHIHYDNPRLIVGCIAEWEGRLLLCRRAIAPRIGYWTLPAGFMENGETTAQAAIRETLEEAGAAVDIDAAFSMISLAHINQIHLFYRGHMITPDFLAGEESLEVALFKPEEIPWEELSFRSVKLCLAFYLRDRQLGRFGFHEHELQADPSSY